MDLDLNVVNRVLPEIEASGVKCMIGFNRRFDSNAQRIQQAIASGELGQLSLLRITSYDPSPPPIEYIKVSGGLFCDMAIHDFDMARFLVDDQVEEVYAVAKSRDPDIKQAGDVDTAMCLLTFTNGVIANIENSRTAVYGYDQRLEVLGTKGGASSANRFHNQVTISSNKSIYSDLPMHFFLDRYKESYEKEMKTFLAVCRDEEPNPVGMHDGREALRLARAADLSLREHRPVKLDEILIC